MNIKELSEIFGRSKNDKELIKEWDKTQTILLNSLCGSSSSITSSHILKSKGGIHIFVCEDRDMASYLCNDLYSLLDEQQVLLFPTAYKRSVVYGREAPDGIVRRTAVLNAIRSFDKGYLAICTYPEALTEKVVDKSTMAGSILSLKQGQQIAMSQVSELLTIAGFNKVDFVYEPGQFSLRGGIIDLFSFSDNRPFRLDFFGDEIDSIRYFEIGTQLSVEKIDSVDIVPNLKRSEGKTVSFASFVGDKATYWFDDPKHFIDKIKSIRTKILHELEEPSQIDAMVTGPKTFLNETLDNRYVIYRDNLEARAAELTIDFETSPQPQFNKQFELLAENFRDFTKQGYRCFILSENRAQIERLTNIFNSLGEREVSFESALVTLHDGFVDHANKLCLYTDHQIFDRHHRYRINNEIEKSEAFTIAELNSLSVGDYIVHIDHGVGRFGGLSRRVENGKVQEAIKLIYRDNDVLLVGVHSLHRISRYKSKDAEPPRVYKLGSGAWQKLKTAAKKAVKDIARELIQLYAKRKASAGFAFMPDGYLQNELEASFIYEDTPDQVKAMAAIKTDMESTVPMDRLVCGDVGFGKTELAVRAAFKAVCDSKQVAVLVPTTILALQHYRTFSGRLASFPVRVEHLSRSKSAAQVRQTLLELKAGKIDILVGTHKILGKSVEFNDLGLLIVDEEQKFGVSAKEKLRQLRANVDTLTLTATPIPRTLQFSLMGARDLSVIKTPPLNRQPVQTESHVFDEELVREAIEYELSRNGQVYYIHNRVEDIMSVAGMIQRLCPAARVGVGHGQLNPQKMEKLMMDFIYGDYDVLVATSIIESGVDVPNANTMIIDNAQRFGLSVLHQLRGRVGRSNRKAFCYLFSPPDEMLSSEARRRLRAIEEFSELGSGFNIAMQDLDIRGAGNLLGGEQSGFVADIGFETYQKILSEAMNELQEEQAQATGEDAAVPNNVNKISSGQGDSVREYISDTQLDTDCEAYLPDDYIGQPSEKLRLYRVIDSLSGKGEIDSFQENMIDRFGSMPEPASGLFYAVRIRGLCTKLGFEKAIIKNGIMILQFVFDTHSSYYRSAVFTSILQVVTSAGGKFKLKQNGDKLSVVVHKVSGLGSAYEVLEDLTQKAQKAIHENN
ncbi:MAG: transcription-repair coupling factor [Rikenellaceae bacterium]